MKKIILTVLAFVFTTLAFAQGPGYQRKHIANHPRVDQVNSRTDNQEKRINNERKEGDLSKSQAQQDRRNLSRITREKRDMRRQDNGHLTKADDKALNHQLNRNSRKIGN